MKETEMLVFVSWKGEVRHENWYVAEDATCWGEGDSGD